MLLTYPDASVLIAAHRGVPAVRERALTLLSDPGRLFVSSPFLYLETVPKALYSRRQSEIEFYRKYFETLVHVSVENVAAIVRLAAAKRNTVAWAQWTHSMWRPRTWLRRMSWSPLRGRASHSTVLPWFA